MVMDYGPPVSPAAAFTTRDPYWRPWAVVRRGVVGWWLESREASLRDARAAVEFQMRTATRASRQAGVYWKVMRWAEFERRRIR